MDDLVNQLMHATVSVGGDFDVGRNVRDAAVERLGRYEWQPIETAPKDGRSIIIAINIATDEFGPRIACGSWQRLAETWFGTCGSSLVIYNPTHWMPLPAAPTNV